VAQSLKKKKKFIKRQEYFLFSYIFSGFSLFSKVWKSVPWTTEKTHKHKFDTANYFACSNPMTSSANKGDITSCMY